MSVIETTRFRLRPATDDATFMEADFRLQTEFIPNHPGFIRRTTARDARGNWITVVLWASEADAMASAARWKDNATAAAFMELIDPFSVDAARYSTLD